MAKKTTTPPETKAATTKTETRGWAWGPKTVTEGTRTRERSYWYEEEIYARDDAWGGVLDEVWDAKASKGASGLSTFMGGGYGYSYSARYYRPDSTYQLTETLRFVEDLASIVAKDHLKLVSWQQEDTVSMADVSNGRIYLDPASVKALGGTPEGLDEAKTIVGGIAIHEAAHLQRTPMSHWIDIKYRADAEELDPHIVESCAALVEDAHVEAWALHGYPGYLAYLDAHWEYAFPEDEQIEKLDEFEPTDGRLLFDLMQDQSRRYRPVGQRYADRLAALPDEVKAFMGVGERILHRAHNAKMGPKERIDLVIELAKLFTSGLVPIPEQDEFGETVWHPENSDELGRHGHQRQLTGSLDGPLKNMNGEGLDEEEAAQVGAALRKALEHEEVEIETAVGTRKAECYWIDANPRPHETRNAMNEIRELVPGLAAKLRFRTNSPERRIGAQLAGRFQDSRIIEFPIAAATGRQPRAYQRREILSAPEVGVTVLVDVSGSMGAVVARDKTRYEIARNGTALIDQALRTLVNESQGRVEYTIRAHSTNYGSEEGIPTDSECCVVYRIVDGRLTSPDRIGDINARANNYDGVAIAACAKEAERLWPNRQRIILYVNDGMPNGWDYGGPPAHEQIHDHCNWLRKRGTEVVTIYFGNHPPEMALNKMYGEEGRGWIRVDDMTALPQLMGRTLTKLLKWQA